MPRSPSQPEGFYHSPDGFNWSYHGSGPAQLALAILLEATKVDLAVQLHQDFKRQFVANFPRSDFEIDIDVEAWIDRKMNIFQEVFSEQEIS